MRNGVDRCYYFRINEVIRLSSSCSRLVIATWLLFLSNSLWAGPDCSGSQLNFPRLSFAAGTLTGAAVVNPNGVAAPITLTAYDTQGDLLQGAGVTNPFSTTIQPNAQFARVTSEIFGAGGPQAVAWFQACSPISDLTGFFLFLDLPTTFLDGADLPIAAAKIVFNDVRVGSGLSTEINIVNPGDDPVDLLLQVLSGGAAPVAAQSTQINGKGVLRLDVESFFGVADLSSGASVVATAMGGSIAGFELIGPDGSNGGGLGGASLSPATATALPDAIGLTARPALEILETLFFPQLAVSPDIGTEIAVTNYTALPEIVTFTAYRPNGLLWTAPVVSRNRVTRNLPGGATVREDAADLFGFASTGVFEGWVKVEGTRASINGAVSYAVPLAGSFAAVSSVPEPRTSAIFSHLATDQGFFTGIAGLNSGAFPANVKVVAMAQSGQVLGEYRTTLTPGQRFSQVVETIIPQSDGQSGGIVWVKSDVPIYLTSIFGTPDGGLPNVLANVPPQPVPDTYRPDQGREFLDIRPIQAILEPNASQTFVNNNGGSTTWRINNLNNPPSSLGQISQSGAYTAPGSPPAGQPITIGATTSNNIGASAADIVVAEEFLSGFGVLQSLVHLENLDALFTAELFAGGGASVAALPAGAPTTRIFEVPVQGNRTEIAEFANQTISKMLAFEATDESEFLILANLSSGQILGLDPLSPVPIVLQGGLSQPTTMAYDADGNLVVADLNGFSVISRGALESGLTGLSAGAGSKLRAARRATRERKLDVLSFPEFLEVDHGFDWGGGGQPAPGLAIPANQLPSFVFGTPGLAFDRCTGDAFVSDPEGGAVVRIDRISGEVLRRFNNISNPGQLLAFHRRDVGCPFSFALLVAERGTDRILLLNPARLFRPVFARATDARDLIFIEGNSDFGETVLFTDGALAPLGNGGGRIFRADVPGLWRRRPTNPPGLCQGSFFLNDPVLHQRVTFLLNLPAATPLTCAQAQSLTELAVIDGAVRDLGNIHFLSGLQALELPFNDISDLSPLARLPGLRVLDLKGNQISDLEPLQQLTSLLVLDLSRNPLGALDPLSSLLTLLALNLEETGSSDISALGTLTRLRTLFLGGNDIVDVSSLESLSELVDLRLEDNEIRNLGPLGGLTKLVTLDLLSNQVRQVTPLRTLLALQKLELGFNQITNLAPLSNLVQLRELGLSTNGQLSDLGPLSNLGALRILFASGNQIPGLFPLVELFDLVQLRVNSNQIRLLDPVMGLTQLDDLQFRDNEISLLKPLVGNQGLTQGDLVDARLNPLDPDVCPDVAALLERGVNLLIDDAVRDFCFGSQR